MSSDLAGPPLILIANDQEWSARSLESILEPSGFAVVRAYTARQALDLAHKALPDVVLVDWRMPDVSGLELVRALRRDPRHGSAMPILMTSVGTVTRAMRLEAFAAGAWEFLTEPIDGELMVQRLRVFVQAKRAVDLVHDDSLLDELTGLYNTRGLARRAQEIGAVAARQRLSLACIAFSPEPLDAGAHGDAEIDLIAERMVGEVGTICRREARLSDAMGRLGHTEFAIIAPATEDQGALRLIERLRHCVEGHSLLIDDRPHPLRLRAGYSAVANFAESAVDAVELLLRATSALRDARYSTMSLPVRADAESPRRQVL